MLIVCAGIYRSGSTWLYNAARLIAQRSGRTVSSGWVGSFEPDPASEVRIVKLHEPDEHYAQKADVILTSRRNPVGIAKSVARLNWADSDERLRAIIAEAIAHHRYWNPLSHYELAYEDLRPFEALHVEAVARVMGMAVDRQTAGSVALAIDALPQAEQGFDPENLLHANHRSIDSSESVTFPPDWTATLRALDPDWFDRWCYAA